MKWKLFSWYDHCLFEKWFAWYPVKTIDGYFVWLLTIYRRWDGSSYDPAWEYCSENLND